MTAAATYRGYSLVGSNADGWTVYDSQGRYIGSGPRSKVEESINAILGGPVPLEQCVCGGCFDCPDGWHRGDELPCSCTPDCALAERGEWR